MAVGCGDGGWVGSGVGCGVDVGGAGSGPVEAFVAALRALGDPAFELTDYAEHAAAAGAGAQAVAYVALRMGLPIDRLVIATNVNDILTRLLATGRYDLREVVPTSAPSMDIQVASNFERLLFEVYGRDARAVKDFGLPPWYYAYPLSRLGYPLLPNRMKRLVRLAQGIHDADARETAS